MNPPAAPTPPTSTPPGPDKKPRRWLPSPVALTFAVLAALVVLGLLLRGGPSNQEQQAERDAISDCWKQAKSPSGSAMEQRNKIAECELKESAFRKQFGGTP